MNILHTSRRRLLALGAGGAALALGLPAARANIATLAAAPDFTLKSLEGPNLRLKEQRGKVVLLNFWATWCKPCEEEMPAMERLHQALSGDAFELLAVSVDAGDDEVRAFRDRLGLGFPILRDPGKQVSQRYQTYRYPESFLIGRDGVIVERYVGSRDWSEPLYLERIRELMGGAKAPGAQL